MPESAVKEAQPGVVMEPLTKDSTERNHRNLELKASATLLRCPAAALPSSNKECWGLSTFNTMRMIVVALILIYWCRYSI